MTTEPEPTEPTPEPTPEPEPEPDDGEAEEAEEAQEPAPQPPEARSDVDMEKAIKALGREVERHTKRVSEIMGPDFEGYDPCALCDSLGFVPGPTRLVQAWKQNGETGLFEWFSQAAAPEEAFLDDATVEKCPTCDGKGQLRTQSEVPTYKVRDCVECGGMGYKPKMAQVAQLQPTQLQTPTEPPEDAHLRYQGDT